jgi:acetoin utilization deacetylase AcuC-like enzyme
MVKTRTVVQTRTHAQKYFQKFAKASGGIPGDDFSVDFMSTGNSNSHRLSAAEMAYVASTASSIGKRVSSMSAPQKRSRKSDGSDVGSLDILASTTKAHGPLLTSASSGSHTQESISLGGMRESYGFPSTLSMNQSKPPALIIPDLHDFPQPSPAACGKRKIAELAAAQVLAGSSSNQDIAGAQVLSMMRDAAFAPGEIVRKRKTLPSLSIVNPDNLDVTGKVPNQGSGPPLTPWDDEVVKLGERVMEVATNQSKYSSIATPSDQRKFLSALRECIRQCNIHALEALIDSAERSSFESANIGLGLSPADTFDEAEFSKREVDVAAALAAAVGGGEMEKEDSASYKDAPPTASQSATKATSMSTTPLSSVCSDSGIRSHHRASGALIRTLNLCGTSGITVLMEASCLPTDRDKGVDQDKILEMCRILVMNGCSPSVIGRTGQTCLHFAASVGYEKVGRLMLNHGCPVNIADEAGDTAAHIAAKYGHGRFLDMLADFGANCHLRNASSRAALDVAGVNIKATDVESWIRTRYELRRIMLSAEPRLRTLVLYHEDCLHHITRRASDWEAKDRLVSIMQRLSDRRIFPEFEIEISSQFDKATVELLQRVHSAEYIAFVNQLSKQVQPSPSMINDGRMASNSMNYNKLLAFTPQVQKAIFHQPQEELKQSEYCDTTFSPGTLRAARRAAGAVAHAVDHVLLGRNRNAFCVVRPPGHHVGHDGLLDGAKSCGFCIFNSVAAGAFHALEAHNCERVAVIDLDIHHGNGTEDIIRRNSKPSRLFFFSLHLYDHDEDSGYEFFPGTGVSDDIVSLMSFSCD